MKIINKTDWDTKSIKRLLSACLYEVKKKEGAKWNLTQQVVYLKSHSKRHVGGHAYVNSSTLYLTLPYEFPEGKIEWWDHEYDFSQMLADTYIHEVGHNLGIRKHTKKGDTHEYLYQDWIFQNVSNEKFPVVKKEKKQKAVVDVKQKRYQSAMLHLAKAERRFKLAKTLYQKWFGKVKYYKASFAIAADKAKK